MWLHMDMGSQIWCACDERRCVWACVCDGEWGVCAGGSVCLD